MSTPDGHVLYLERRLLAPRAAVYRALTDPAELGKWWGPKGFTTPSVAFDPTVGACYRIAMQPPHGELFHLFGEIRRLEPPARLAYTFCWDPPHPDDQETLASLTLDERGTTTEVLLEQGTFATQERHALHHAGWTESFDRLEHLLGDSPESAAGG
jgi:uncharacterized protein YndB with AHSA1/START domain